MRTMLWTVFLVVALQGMASASTAFASPMPASPSASSDSVPVAETMQPRPDAGASKAQAALPAELGQKSERPPVQVLSKNFPSPKPVQIYWFFGGR